MNNQTLTNSMATEAKELSDLLARKKTDEPKSERLPYSHNLNGYYKSTVEKYPKIKRV